jgi:hypothetical protein
VANGGPAEKIVTVGCWRADREPCLCAAAQHARVIDTTGQKAYS